MHISTEIKDLFIKFIERKCSDEEVEQILTYVKKSENLSEVPTVDEVYYMLNDYPNMKEANANIMFNTILEIDKQSTQKFSWWKYAVASVVVIIIFSGYFFKNIMPTPVSDKAPVMVNNIIQKGTDKATLTLEDGKEIHLEKDKTHLAGRAISNGKALVYNTQNASVSETHYNYLTIPRGGQFQLQLSDGTKVWLNSESKLKYPVAFIKGETRMVELLYGEAYFEVSPSSLNHGSRFNVQTHIQRVEVLGTSFNIKAYKGDQNMYTTLVEGKVDIHSSGYTHHLFPNQQSILNLNSENLSIQTIDVYNEISWKNGLFSFKSKPLKDIVTVLSRWYDVDFEFSDQVTEEVKFNGVLLKEQSLEEILTIIRETEFITAYEISDKKIIIK